MLEHQSKNKQGLSSAKDEKVKELEGKIIAYRQLLQGDENQYFNNMLEFECLRGTENMEPGRFLGIWGDHSWMSTLKKNNINVFSIKKGGKSKRRTKSKKSKKSKTYKRKTGGKSKSKKKSKKGEKSKSKKKSKVSKKSKRYVKK
jgi:hypothetical protein